jgi:hypothetical protein
MSRYSRKENVARQVAMDDLVWQIGRSDALL